MANVIIYDGVGATISDGTTTLDAKKIEIPLGSRTAIEVTRLANSAVKTKALSKLREIADFTVTVGMNTDYLSSLVDEDATQWTITLPDSGGTYSFYGGVSAMSNPSLEADTEPTIDLTFTVTNLNSGAESAPAHTAAS
jgi:hypothetical protein